MKNINRRNYGKEISFLERHLIDIDEKGAVKVSKAGAPCDNAKAALREIAEAAGFEVDEKWNTQQFGAKLAKFLEEAAPAPAAKPKAKAPKTEKKGDAAFNQRLSEARAQAAVDFMINHEGIAADRLEAVGKGFTEPKNPDDPTAPENRRTEFIVLE